MRNKTQEAIEFSNWMFPVIILSGWLAPLIFVINVIIELIKLLF